MKKLFMLVAVVLMVVTLTACAEPVTTNRTEIDAVVVKCEEGKFVPNPMYVTLATKAMASGDPTKYMLYNSLAKSTGTQKYDIIVKIGEETFVVERDQEYEVGITITILQVDTYQGEKLITTEYE